MWQTQYKLKKADKLCCAFNATGIKLTYSKYLEVYIMLFTDYLDSIKNTEKETHFLEKLAETKNDLAQATEVPVVGKLMKSLVALSDYSCVETFEQSEHYNHIVGWDIDVNEETGNFNIYPGAQQRKKIFVVFAAVCAGILGLWLTFKCCRKKVK